MEISNEKLEKLKNLIKRIRIHMRDFPQLNYLIEDVENSDYQIASALKYVVDYFNLMPPLIGTFDWLTIPESLLILGTIGKLQQEVVDLDERNYIAGSDGKVTVQTRAKAPMVKQSSFSKWQEFTQRATMYKVSKNLESSIQGVALASPADGTLDYYLIILGRDLPDSQYF
jgi:hypothetical protein